MKQCESQPVNVPPLWSCARPAQYGLVFCLLFLLVGCAPTESQEDRLLLFDPDFSVDNKTLLLTYCPPRMDCTQALYDVVSGHLSVFQAPEREGWVYGKFSADGKQILLVVTKKDDTAVSQIAIVNRDGSGYRVLTSTKGYKGYPSFSPDGKRILFTKSGRERSSGKTRFADFDIYELDIARKLETRLTEFEFFLISGPQYFPDGEHFIFGGEHPNHSAAYKEKFQENNIMIMSKLNRNLQPAFTRGDHSDWPSISVDGSKILFTSRSNDLDNSEGSNFNYDLFLKTPDGITRLTKLESVITYGTLSPSGSRIVFLSDKERGRKEDLIIMNSDGTDMKKIDLPAPSRVIRVTGD